MRIRILLAVFSVVMFPVFMLAGDAKTGEAVFMRSCKACHGPDGHGNPAIAKALNVGLPDLPSKVQTLKDEDIKNTVMNGKGKMKPVKSISENEIPDVIAFLRTLAKK